MMLLETIDLLLCADNCRKFDINKSGVVISAMFTLFITAELSLQSDKVEAER